MLTGIHFLLSYKCDMECDHCFLYSSPRAKGTFTISQMKKVFEELKKIGTIESVYFEGGEPFLFYPLMLEGIKIARSMGLKTGIVTNAYWATSQEDAELWLKPLLELGVSSVSVSDDLFHHDEKEENPARKALAAAKSIGVPVDSICIEKPVTQVDKSKDKGAPVVGGSAMFRGRAVEKLLEGFPMRPWEEFKECPYENLMDPKRVHLDSFGNVHLCQGLSMGNMWHTPLSALVRKYNADSHPICGPLARGGPSLLAKEYGVKHADKYADACHFCYSIRLALLDRFPEYLAPKLVYGVE
jgi:hypothetical protein